MSLSKTIEEQSAFARSNRRLSHGIVVSLDTLNHTCTLDVGATDTQGAAVLLRDVPFQPQSPPALGDSVTFNYTSISAHSINISGGQLGGSNPQGSISVVGNVVNSVHSDSNTFLKGDVRLVSGTGVTLTQAGQDITISAGSSAGVSSIKANSSTPLTGAVQLLAGTNITLTEAGQAITIDAASGGSSGVTSIHADSASNITGAVHLVSGTNVTLTQSGQDVSFSSPLAIQGDLFNSTTASVLSASQGKIQLVTFIPDFTIAGGGSTSTTFTLPPLHLATGAIPQCYIFLIYNLATYTATINTAAYSGGTPSQDQFSDSTTFKALAINQKLLVCGIAHSNSNQVWNIFV